VQESRYAYVFDIEVGEEARVERVFIDPYAGAVVDPAGK
jgi:hypothetical protein